MKTEDLEIIKSSQLETLSISVTEEIQPKYLEDFLKTNIHNSSILLSLNTQYYYQYIKQTLTYELIVFDTHHQNFIVEPFILLENRKKEQENKNILYLLENYFVLVKNNQLLLFKFIEDIEKDAVIRYLKSGYNINVDEVILVESSELERRKKELFPTKKRIASEKRFNSLYPKKSYFYFLLFVATTTIIFFTALVVENFTHTYIKKKPSELLLLEKRYHVLSEEYKKNNKKPLFELFKILKKANTHHVLIENIEYANNLIKLSLLDQDKKVLFDFVASQKDATINKIEYDEKSQIFTMEVCIAI